MQIVEGRLTAASIAIFSVAGTPVLIDVLDVCTENEKLNLKVQSLIDPDTDIHATADYRRQLVKTLVAQALTEARSNAESRTS